MNVGRGNVSHSIVLKILLFPCEFEGLRLSKLLQWRSWSFLMASSNPEFAATLSHHLHHRREYYCTLHPPPSPNIKKTTYVLGRPNIIYDSIIWLYPWPYHQSSVEWHVKYSAGAIYKIHIKPWQVSFAIYVSVLLIRQQWASEIAPWHQRRLAKWLRCDEG